MAVAAINITHTFLMIVYERKREIGILRAVGATRWDVRLLMLLEAGLIGVVAGGLGNLVCWGLSRLTNLALSSALVSIPFKPDDFFAFSPEWVLGSMAVAVVFCLAGAYFPANRAASLDPAYVLSLQ
jgi:ABC-type antimicrobial peptide transport system permease subunit